MSLPLVLKPWSLAGGARAESGPAPLAGGVWYTAGEVGDGLLYSFPVGALAQARWLTADLLVDGTHLAVFELSLQEGEDGPRFALIFSALNQCSARMRVQTEAVNQNRWRYEREGAWLKPMCAGSRVSLERVDRMAIKVLRKSDSPVRWCITSVVARADEPPLLDELVLPKGPLLDEMGQSAIHDWPGKSRSPEEVSERLRSQAAQAPKQAWPKGFSRWGGWKARRFGKSGFFRTHRDGKRWWLVDPDGCAFFSAGMDCVRVDTESACRGLSKALAWMPDAEGPYRAIYDRGPGLEHKAHHPVMINYLAANFIRAFGPKEWHSRWGDIALAELRRMGFNTVANWSEWDIASRARFPYVRHLRLSYARTPFVYRDFPDVFNPGFVKDAGEFGEQLEDTAKDPALIGYFMMNEPTWGFSSETPAAGMLFNTPDCETRRVLGDFLKRRYRTDARLAKAWKMRTGLSAVSSGPWRTPLTPEARADLAAFSAIMVERKFKLLADSCRTHDPDHLNLGIRYFTVPPDWAVEGMKCFDVFSVNGYENKVRDELGRIAQIFNQPVMVGEWHFGALDAGLPASGIGRVASQEDRGRAFRAYTEDAAAKSWCVGVHWFTLYDESALGRFDGENWNIGFLDVANRPYEEIARAARLSHERMYAVASGECPPFADAPEYLPKLFL